jgi:hypothetical protein
LRRLGRVVPVDPEGVVPMRVPVLLDIDSVTFASFLRC